MTIKDLEFAFAKPADEASIKALLAECGLPHEDVGDRLFNFILARSGCQIVGVVGLEVLADVGLLRSLAVAASHRAAGIGKKLCALEEAYASLMGVKELYLVTLGAEGFFRKRAYQTVHRTHVPTSIRSTKEFHASCLPNSVCMLREMSSLLEENPENSL